MRRISIWVLSTLSALVLLFGYSTSTSGPLATTASSSVESNPPISSSTASASGGTGTSGSTSSGAAPSGSAAGTTGGSTSGSAKATKKTTVTGSVASTRWGPVQVELTLADGTISKVTVVQYPSGNPKDAEINDYALPILTQETVTAQSAQIDMVSGATITSGGYVESLQSALDQAGL